MYCVNCGIKLGDAEEKCPLCSARTGEPIRRELTGPKLYPPNCYPDKTVKNGALNGTILFLFVMPLFITFVIDLQTPDGLSWFWYTLGALLLGYIIFALPLWFQKPNPVIFVPCDFGATALYLLLIDLMTGGKWFLSFALPLTFGIGLIITAVVTLLRYLKKGKLYVWGGGFLAMGGLLVLTELLIKLTFGVDFIGWSIYPLIVLSVLGGLLIFLAINSSAREKMERRFFF